MQNEELLFLAKSIYGSRKAEIPQVIELLTQIHHFKIIELVDFSIEIKNVILKFRAELVEISQTIGHNDFRMIHLLQNLVRKLHSGTDIIGGIVGAVKIKEPIEGTVEKSESGVTVLELHEKVAAEISEICFRNENLKIFIDGFKRMEQKLVILNGLDFVYGIYKGLNDDRKLGIIITRLLIHTWNGIGVKNEQLLPITKT
jgi:hypothetical protein